MTVTDTKINKVCNVLEITPQLAKELLLLAGGDVDLVIMCSKRSNGLDHCKANIMNKRFTKLEKGISNASKKGNENTQRKAEDCFRNDQGL